MAKNKGICAICGKGTKLTFEHVPPKAAGNEEDVIVYGIEEWLSRDLESGEMPGGYVQPQGTGTISICKSCNEYSGKWYVPEFGKFVHTGVGLFRQLTTARIEKADASLEWKAVDFKVKGMRALPVVKQIVASLLALNAPEFGQKNPDLVKFVLDHKIQGLPEKYRLYMCLFAGPIARFAGLAVELNVVTQQTVYMTELAHPPFAYLLTIDSEPSQPTGEITVWTTRDFDEARDERLVLTLGFGNTAFPGDYRSKAKVEAERAANNAVMKEKT
ncbi:MAG TPA: hypothetical protein VI485_07995 [Vicinamibacterales bacterium]|nr:hypothetical protein [Vicinamibacterales bacterium]